MNRTSNFISEREVSARLDQVRREVVAWLELRRADAQPFGHFSACAHAYQPDELDAATTGLELWVMLDLPLSPEQKAQAVTYLKSFQDPETGLVVDPSWAERVTEADRPTWQRGDSFFTMTTAEALTALGACFDHPVRYLAGLPANALIAKTNPQRSAQHAFAIGDYASLVAQNRRLDVPGSPEQWRALLEFIEREQDPASGLWPAGKVAAPFTPAINRSFHFLRSTWNLVERPYRRASRMIDTCLDAAGDAAYYGWNEGEACNDLDLALVIYSASCWTGHRSKDVQNWAAQQLPKFLDVQKSDGGFSYKHNAAMSVHNTLPISPGLPEGDLWGTLMYLGALKMVCKLAYPEVVVPWKFSQIHRVPRKSSPLRAWAASLGRREDLKRMPFPR